MLRRTFVAQKISPYALFTKESYPAVKHMKFAERGRATAASYKALSAEDKAALFARAELVPTPPKKVKTARAPSAYARFTKENYSKVEGTFKERTQKIAQMWKAQKQQ